MSLKIDMYISVADPAVPPTATPSPSLFLDQTEARREYLRVWMTGGPPYLKVWIRRCILLLPTFLLSAIPHSQPPPQALRFSHGRGERETRVTGDEPQGTMGCAHFHQKRDVWVRGSHTPSPARLRAEFLIFPSYLLLRSLVGLSASLTRDLGTRLFSHYFFCFYIYFIDFIFSSLDICFIPFTFGTTVLIGTFVNI